MPKKKIKNTLLDLLKIESAVVILLVLILLTQIIGASFIMSKMKLTNDNIVSLNMQFIRMNNDQIEIKNKLDVIQNMVLRMQAQIFRAQNEEE